MLRCKNIVLGVTGSIAAYKALMLTRMCVDRHANVWPVLTASACRFVGPLSFSVLAGQRAVTDMWSAAEAGEVGHIALAQMADLLVIAPATADTLARLANGRADDPLSAVALATRAPWIVAPAMESGMWENPATRDNLALLRERGAVIVPPGEGFLASGGHGPGRMAEPEQIFDAIHAALSEPDMAGEEVLLTAGPTREAVDPVRFLSNHSSGKMGHALARTARARGARVHLISGPTTLPPPGGVRMSYVNTTQEMLEACRAQLQEATILVMAAAPADWRPVSPKPQKIKKTAQQGRIELLLEATPDILRTLKPRTHKRLVIGFAAESEALVRNARAKLQAKDLDMVVANDITRTDSGFGSENNQVHILTWGKDEVRSLPLLSKEAVAHEIWDAAKGLRRERTVKPT